MANRSAILAIRIIADAAGASRGFDQAQGRMARFEAGARRAGVAATAVVGGMAAIGAAAVSSASRAQQAAGAVESVFGRQAAAVQGLAASAATSVGLATSEYSELASVLGAQLNNLGVAQSQLVPTTDSLIKKGADLAATFGGTTAEAVEALSSLFRGETDPIERYGVSIKQSDINARLAAQGMSGLTGEALRQAETQARLAILTEQTAKATGQFARESDTTAGAQQRMAAQFENAKASLGESLLPIVSQFAEKLAGAAEWAQRNTTTVGILAGIIGGLAVAVLAVNAALTLYRTAATVATAVQWALNSAFLANPLTWIVIAIIAVIAAVVLLYTKCEWFRNAVHAVIRWVASAWSWITDAVSTVAGAIGRILGGALDRIRSVFDRAFGFARSIIRAVGDAIDWVVGLVRGLIDWIGRLRWPSPPSWLTSIFGGGPAEFMAVPTMAAAPWENFAAAGPELSAARADPLSMLARIAAPTRAGAATIINVRVDGSGIVDPARVADAVTSALRSTAVARGTSPAGLIGGRR
ncbi:tail length tape measure protein [Gordonia phage Emperor]|uniref:Tape measure protein n=2 Tax=root TaxID=1 RepID=A0A2Z4Q3S8_9CAUD|nr:hypothetical protein [Gordonia westfalica]YP_010674613.1 tail length tape measure protein [Gordonia phage Emperor]AWY04762.1 tape measure protein [Gordonia phage Emperor]SDU50369.1 hypothetical protein SAMN04488548_1341647 [Gordonia westfalica]